MEDLEVKEFEARLSLAAAMARRQISEVARCQSLVSEAAEQEIDQASQTVQAMVATGVTVVMLNQLEKPVEQIDIKTFMDSVLDNQTINQIILDNGGNPEDVEDGDRDNLRAMTCSMVDMRMGHLGFDELNPIDELKKTLDAAHDVADTHQVPVEAVFNDGVMYGEMIRAKETIEEFASRNLGAVGKMDDDFAIKTLTTMTEPMVRLELGNEADESEVASEVQDLIAEMLEDKELVAQLLERVSTIRQASRLALVMELKRFWGDDALSDLSPELRQELLS